MTKRLPLVIQVDSLPKNIPAVIRSLDSSDVNVVLDSIHKLSLVCGNMIASDGDTKEKQKRICDTGCIPKLVRLVNHFNTTVQAIAALSLQLLMMNNDESKDVFHASNGSAAFTKALSCTSKVRWTILHTLHEFIVDSKRYKEAIVQAQGIFAIVEVLQHEPDLGICLTALKVIQSLLESTRVYQNAFRDAHIFPLLTGFLSGEMIFHTVSYEETKRVLWETSSQQTKLADLTKVEDINEDKPISLCPAGEFLDRAFDSRLPSNDIDMTDQLLSTLYQLLHLNEKNQTAFFDCGGVLVLLDMLQREQNPETLKLLLINISTCVFEIDSLTSLLRSRKGIALFANILKYQAALPNNNDDTSNKHTSKVKTQHLNIIDVLLHKKDTIATTTFQTNNHNSSSNIDIKKSLKLLEAKASKAKILYRTHDKSVDNQTDNNNDVFPTVSVKMVPTNAEQVYFPVVAILWQMMREESSDIDAFRVEGGIAILVYLLPFCCLNMGHLTSQLLEYVFNCILKISSYKERNQNALRHAGIIPTLVCLLQPAKFSIPFQENAAGVLCNLCAGNVSNQNAVREHGGIHRLIALLERYPLPRPVLISPINSNNNRDNKNNKKVDTNNNVFSKSSNNTSSASTTSNDNTKSKSNNISNNSKPTSGTTKKSTTNSNTTKKNIDNKKSSKSESEESEWESDVLEDVADTTKETTKNNKFQNSVTNVPDEEDTLESEFCDEYVIELHINICKALQNIGMDNLLNQKLLYRLSIVPKLLHFLSVYMNYSAHGSVISSDYLHLAEVSVRVLPLLTSLEDVPKLIVDSQGLPPLIYLLSKTTDRIALELLVNVIMQIVTDDDDTTTNVQCLRAIDIAIPVLAETVIAEEMIRTNKNTSSSNKLTSDHYRPAIRNMAISILSHICKFDAPSQAYLVQYHKQVLDIVVSMLESHQPLVTRNIAASALVHFVSRDSKQAKNKAIYSNSNSVLCKHVIQEQGGITLLLRLIEEYAPVVSSDNIIAAAMMHHSNNIRSNATTMNTSATSAMDSTSTTPTPTPYTLTMTVNGTPICLYLVLYAVQILGNMAIGDVSMSREICRQGGLPLLLILLKYLAAGELVDQRRSKEAKNTNIINNNTNNNSSSHKDKESNNQRFSELLMLIMGAIVRMLVLLVENNAKSRDIVLGLDIVPLLINMCILLGEDHNGGGAKNDEKCVDLLEGCHCLLFLLGASQAGKGGDDVWSEESIPNKSTTTTSSRKDNSSGNSKNKFSSRKGVVNQKKKRK